jgi:hypothetical protein
MDADSFYYGQSFKPFQTLGFTSSIQVKRILEQNPCLLHVAAENCFHISLIDFQSRAQKGEIRRGLGVWGQGNPKKIAVALRMSRVAYTDALIREFSLAM